MRASSVLHYRMLFAKKLVSIYPAEQLRPVLNKLVLHRVPGFRKYMYSHIYIPYNGKNWWGLNLAISKIFLDRQTTK